jgi:hypothetical protein
LRAKNGLDNGVHFTVIQNGKVSIDDMLAGKIRDEIVLSEQTFVHA